MDSFYPIWVWQVVSDREIRSALRVLYSGGLGLLSDEDLDSLWDLVHKERSRRDKIKNGIAFDVVIRFTVSPPGMGGGAIDALRERIKAIPKVRDVWPSSHPYRAVRGPGGELLRTRLTVQADLHAPGEVSSKIAEAIENTPRVELTVAPYS